VKVGLVDHIARADTQPEGLGANYLLTYRMSGDMTMEQSMASRTLFHSAVTPVVDRM